MAIIEKRDGIYRIDFRFIGRRHRPSLKTRSLKEAELRLALLEDTLRRVELGSLEIPEGVVDVAAFLLSGGRLNGKPKQVPKIETLGQLCDQAMDSIPDGSLEESTVKGMRIHIRHLKKLLKVDTKLAEIGLNRLQAYVNDRSKQKGRRGSNIRPATIKKELVTLRWMWNWAQRSGLVDAKMPRIRDLRFTKISEKPPFQTWDGIERKIARGGLTKQAEAELWSSVFLTIPEIEEILQHVKKTARCRFVHPMFALAAYTGARRSEIIRSDVEDIDLSGGFITIHEKKRARGKLTTRRVPLSPKLKAVLEEWLQEHPGGRHTFCLGAAETRSGSNGHNGFLTLSQVLTNFEQALSGSKWSKLRGWHVFRHSFCSNCAAAGLDQRVINAWVGHQTDEMVRRYRHLFPDKQQEDIRRVFSHE